MHLFSICLGTATGSGSKDTLEPKGAALSGDFEKNTDAPTNQELAALESIEAELGKMVSVSKESELANQHGAQSTQVNHVSDTAPVTQVTSTGSQTKANTAQKTLMPGSKNITYVISSPSKSTPLMPGVQIISQAPSSGQSLPQNFQILPQGAPSSSTVQMTQPGNIQIVSQLGLQKVTTGQTVTLSNLPMPGLGLPKTPTKATSIKPALGTQPVRMVIASAPMTSQDDIRNIAAAVASQISSHSSTAQPIFTSPNKAAGASLLSPAKGQIVTFGSPGKPIAPSNKVAMHPVHLRQFFCIWYIKHSTKF